MIFVCHGKLLFQILKFLNFNSRTVIATQVLVSSSTFVMKKILIFFGSVLFIIFLQFLTPITGNFDFNIKSSWKKIQPNHVQIMSNGQNVCFPSKARGCWGTNKFFLWIVNKIAATFDALSVVYWQSLRNKISNSVYKEPLMTLMLSFDT